MSRTAPPWRQAAQADRQAFDRALAPTYPELLQAAQRELRHRLTLGQFAPDNPTPEQLLDMALQRVWRERRRLSPTLGIKAFALASIFRTAEALAAREDERSRTTTELFPEEVEPDPLYENDDDFGNRMSWNIRRIRKSSAAPSIARGKTSRRKTSLSAGSLRASVKSCSCTRSMGCRCRRSRWPSGLRRLKRRVF